MGLSIHKRELPIDVLTAARQRIVNASKSGVKIYVSISGGKDSIVMTDIVYRLIMSGQVPASLFHFVFIDEEAMFDCVIEIVMKWRRRLLAVGCEFTWFCMEYKHFNCLNTLEEGETFICWDRYKKDVWVRPMPPFAVTSHPLFKPRKENYQAFLTRLTKDGIAMLGMRAYESIQRLSACVMDLNNGYKAGYLLYPIYDWRDGDVFKYILDNDVEFPEVYQFMWQTGVPKNRMRISQFFSIDTARVLKDLYEFYPDLAERVNRREPNAYLVQLYFDTEMFRRSTKKRKEIEDDSNRDYRSEVLALLKDIDGNFDTEHKRKIAHAYRRVVIKHCSILSKKNWKYLHKGLTAGDPKQRILRSVQMTLRREDA